MLLEGITIFTINGVNYGLYLIPASIVVIMYAAGTLIWKAVAPEQPKLPETTTRARAVLKEFNDDIFRVSKEHLVNLPEDITITTDAPVMPEGDLETLPDTPPRRQV